MIISEFSEAETERFVDLLREQTDERGEPVEAVRLYGIKEYPICFLLICRRAYKSGSQLFDRLPTVIQARRRPDINHIQKG